MWLCFIMPVLLFSEFIFSKPNDPKESVPTVSILPKEFVLDDRWVRIGTFGSKKQPPHRAVTFKKLLQPYFLSEALSFFLTQREIISYLAETVDYAIPERLNQIFPFQPDSQKQKNRAQLIHNILRFISCITYKTIPNHRQTTLEKKAHLPATQTGVCYALALLELTAKRILISPPFLLKELFFHTEYKKVQQKIDNCVKEWEKTPDESLEEFLEIELLFQNFLKCTNCLNRWTDKPWWTEKNKYIERIYFKHYVVLQWTTRFFLEQAKNLETYYLT